jgi:hypothetical protein
LSAGRLDRQLATAGRRFESMHFRSASISKKVSSANIDIITGDQKLSSAERPTSTAEQKMITDQDRDLDA